MSNIGFFKKSFPLHSTLQLPQLGTSVLGVQAKLEALRQVIQVARGFVEMVTALAVWVMKKSGYDLKLFEFSFLAGDKDSNLNPNFHTSHSLQHMTLLSAEICKRMSHSTPCQWFGWIGWYSFLFDITRPLPSDLKFSVFVALRILQRAFMSYHFNYTSIDPR